MALIFKTKATISLFLLACILLSSGSAHVSLFAAKPSLGGPKVQVCLSLSGTLCEALSASNIQDEEKQIIRGIIGPGYYGEARGYIEAPVIDPKNKNLRFMRRVEFGGDIGSWLKLQPNPLIVSQGETEWVVLTMDVPADVKPGVYKGFMKIYSSWILDGKEVGETSVMTVLLEITVDPRGALLNAIDKLEASAMGSLDCMIDICAKSLALYDETFDFNWFQELTGLGATIADILAPTPDDIEKIPLYLQRLHRVLTWISGAEVVISAGSFWREFSKWSKEPDKPSSLKGKIRFYRSKILNDYEINFTVTGAGGELSLSYKRRGLSKLYDFISSKCEDLRRRINRIPNDRLRALATNYASIMEVIDRYSEAFSRSQFEIVSLKKDPEVRSRDEDLLETWVFGRLDFYDLMRNAAKERGKGSRWQWVSIAATVGSTVTTLCVAGGFVTGGLTWWVGGAIALGGISTLTNFKGTMHEATAEEIAISTITQIGVMLKDGKNGPGDLTGSFLDCIGIIGNLISGKTHLGSGVHEHPCVYSIAPLLKSRHDYSSASEEPISASLRLSTPDIILSEGDDSGTATGSLIIRYTGSVEAKASGRISVYIPAGAQGKVIRFFSYVTPSVRIKPGASVKLRFPYFGVSSSWWGSCYLVEAVVTFTSRNGETRRIGPVTSKFYVGSPREISSIAQREERLMEERASYSGVRFEKTFHVRDRISSFTLLLTSSGGDFDLHLYEVDGKHVGYNYAEGRIECQVPSSSYSGRNSKVERITVSMNVMGRSYRVVVLGYSRVKDEKFTVRMIKTPMGKSVITVCPSMINETVQAGRTLQLPIQVWKSGSRGEIHGKLRVEGEIAEWISVPSRSIFVPYKDMTVINVTVNVPEHAEARKTYSGRLIVDAGKDGVKAIPVSINVLPKSRAAGPFMEVSPPIDEFINKVMLSTFTSQMITLGLYPILHLIKMAYKSIASLISRYEALEVVETILLLPVDRILRLSLQIYEMLDIESWSIPDIPALILILITAMLITAVYTAPLIIVVNLIGRREPPRGIFRATKYMLAVSLFVLALSWIMKIPLLMTIGGTLLVLSTSAVTALTIALVAANMRKPK